MVDSCFVEFKLDHQSYSEKLASIGDGIMEFTSGGEDVFMVDCSLRQRSEYGKQGEYLCLGLSLLSKSESTNPVFEAFVAGKDGAPRRGNFWMKSPSHENRAKVADVIPGSTDEYWKFLYSWDHLLKRSDLESLWAANGGVVTILCGVVVRRDNPITVPASGILGHLRSLLDCADGSDVSFSVGDETFRAHRAVLAARSPVFKAELFGAMAEAQMPCITLHEIDSVTFKALLYFIYTDALPMDSVGDRVDVFQHLLAAADRYALDRLKLLCALKLWDLVSADTVADLLACAETYNCQELKDSCMDFFVAEENFRRATLTEGFMRAVGAQVSNHYHGAEKEIWDIK